MGFGELTLAFCGFQPAFVGPGKRESLFEKRRALGCGDGQRRTGVGPPDGLRIGCQAERFWWLSECLGTIEGQPIFVQIDEVTQPFYCFLRCPRQF